MVQFILMFFPAFISISTEEKLLKKKSEIQQLITKYGFYTAINNIVIFLILYIMLEEKDVLLNGEFFNIYFIFKYSIISFIISIFSGATISILNKYFDITLKHEKEN
jgi:prolipoprotein diacylglyceryltransferase